jgi:hypothetical protein
MLLIIIYDNPEIIITPNIMVITSNPVILYRLYFEDNYKSFFLEYKIDLCK